MSGAEIWSLVRRWAWLAIGGALVGGALAVLISMQLPRTYAASTRLLVTAGDSAVLTGGGNLAPDQILATYAQVLQSRPVVEAAFAASGQPMLYEDALRSIDVAPLRGTQIIALTVRSGSPETAASLANQLAVAAVQQSRAAQANQFAARRGQVADAASQLAQEVANRAQQLEQARSRAGGAAASAEEVTASQAALSDAELRYAAAVRAVSEQDLAATRVGDPLSTVEPAVPPTIPSAPRLLLNALLGALIGLVLATLVAAAIELGGDSVASPAALTRRAGLPLWAVLPLIDSSSGRTLSDAPDALEAFRGLRTAVASAVSARGTSVAIVSARPAEGTTTVAVGLAAAWARAGDRVVLVDANVDAPRLAGMFGLETGAGLAGWLDGDAPLDQLSSALQHTGQDNLDVLPWAEARPLARDLLDSRQMARLIDQLSATNDRVVIDLPPLAGGAMVGLVQHVNAVVLVVDGYDTRGATVSGAASSLRGTGASPVGIVLNRGAGGRSRRLASPVAGQDSQRRAQHDLQVQP